MQVLSKMINVDDELCSNWSRYYKEGEPNLMNYLQNNIIGAFQLVLRCLNY